MIMGKHNYSVIIGLLVVFIVFIIGWYEVIEWMYQRYISPDSYYSHGFIIPFISGYLIWANKSNNRMVLAEKSWLGFFIIIFAILLHCLGTMFYVFSLSGVSILFLLIGVFLFVFGKNLFKLNIFPVIFLVFMIPMPMALIDTISFPLKLIVAKAGAVVASSIGIPVFQEGFNITISKGTLLVGNPCSGLRSLIALLMLGIIFSYFSRISGYRKIVLFFSTIPWAIFSNIIRVSILILISQFFGLEAASPDSFWHNASGVFIFIFVLLGVFMTERLLNWKI